MEIKGGCLCGALPIHSRGRPDERNGVAIAGIARNSRAALLPRWFECPRRQ